MTPTDAAMILAATLTNLSWLAVLKDRWWRE